MNSIDLFHIIKPYEKSKLNPTNVSKCTFRTNSSLISLHPSSQDLSFENMRKIFEDFGKIMKTLNISGNMKNNGYSGYILYLISKHCKQHLEELNLKDFNLPNHQFKQMYLIFPQIRILRLEHITLPDYISFILNESSSVEELTITSCSLDKNQLKRSNINNLKINQNLKKISFNANNYIGSHEILNNIHTIAPNLKELTFNREKPETLQTPQNFSKLNQLTILNLSFDFQSPAKILQCLNTNNIQLKELTLIEAKFQILDYEKLSKLTSLEILKFKQCKLPQNETIERHLYQKLINLREITFQITNFEHYQLKLNDLISWNKNISTIKIQHHIHLSFENKTKISFEAQKRNKPIEIELYEPFTKPNLDMCPNKWIKITKKTDINAFI